MRFPSKFFRRLNDAVTESRTRICRNPLQVGQWTALTSFMVEVYWSATPDAEIFDTRVEVDLKPPPRVTLSE